MKACQCCWQASHTLLMTGAASIAVVSVSDCWSTQAQVCRIVCTYPSGDAERHCRQQAHEQQHQGAAHSGDQPCEGQAARCSQHQPPHLHCHLSPLLAPPPPRHPQAPFTGTERQTTTCMYHAPYTIYMQLLHANWQSGCIEQGSPRCCVLYLF